MKALITGASSGIGREIAKVLSDMGYDIIAVARREDKLLSLKEEVGTGLEILRADVTKDSDLDRIVDCMEEVDVFINNAGFGVFGAFDETDLASELSMIDTNVRAVHILTKLAVKIFKKKGKGHILNVASAAGFFAGPLFSSYYASKNYVLRLSEGIYEELRRDGSDVTISVLCPGPVNTEFGTVAKVSLGNGNEKAAGMVFVDKYKVAEYAIDKMFKGKLIIVPGTVMKIGIAFRRFVSEKLLLKAVYYIQSKKCIKK